MTVPTEAERARIRRLLLGESLPESLRNDVLSHRTALAALAGKIRHPVRLSNTLVMPREELFNVLRDLSAGYARDQLQLFDGAITPAQVFWDQKEAGVAIIE